MGELTRRELLRISAGTLLTLGLWPGRLRGDDLAGVSGFAFVVLNDLHFREPACAPWFEEAVTALKASSPAAELCLIAGDLADYGTSEQLAGVRDAFQKLGFQPTQRSATMTTSRRRIGGPTSKSLETSSTTPSSTVDGNLSVSTRPTASSGKIPRSCRQRFHGSTRISPNLIGAGRQSFSRIFRSGPASRCAP